MKKLSLLLLMTTIGSQAMASSVTMADAVGSSDKRDYPVKIGTMGRAIISHMRLVLLMEILIILLIE